MDGWNQNDWCFGLVMPLLMTAFPLCWALHGPLVEGPTKVLSEVNQWQIFVFVFCGLTWLIFIFISFNAGIWNWPLHPCAGPLVSTERLLLRITFWTHVPQHQPNVLFSPLLSHFGLGQSIPKSPFYWVISGWRNRKLTHGKEALLRLSSSGSSLRSLCWSSHLFV